MKWASAISDLPDLDAALDAALEDASAALAAEADLAFVFVGPYPTRSLGLVPHRVRARLPRAMLLGASGGGVVGGGLEIERRTAVSVALASLPGVEIVPWHVDPRAFDPRGEVRPDALGPLRQLDRGAMIVVADPFTVDAGALVRALDRHAPSATKVGGLASGAPPPGPNALFLGEATHDRGAAWVTLRGVSVDTLVAQGCRPIGDAMFVTRHRGHLLAELNGKPVSRVVAELHEGLSPEDRALFRSALVLGVAPEDRREYGPGDFVMRAISGLERESGGLLTATSFHDYQVVRFHLRDPRASEGELEAILGRHRDATPDGALLFSCVDGGGPGTETFHRVLGPHVPLAGFFGQGEIGPVRGRTFVHGATSSFAMFRRA